MTVALIGLGSNLGDRAAHLRTAIAGLDAHVGIEVRCRSRFYETAPVGGPPQGDYLNACVLVESTLTVRALFTVLRDLERVARRVRTERNAPRTLDLDLLLFGDETCCDRDLTVPHPRMTERAFVLVPAREIAAELVHPVLGRRLSDIPIPDYPTQAVRAID
ncbi:MAG: 2-amino-4-hydroxy-6-hydroxymethyldihydropteridine diphosphokinase [Planctomycetes bacterium]|nr:2-amino-4-hydroxy-6-hydroxymethyldihydropteridine diphosphokinase [Planctomycetota bacterium]